MAGNVLIDDDIPQLIESTSLNYQPWILPDALKLCRLTEDTLKLHKYHVALGGSVLHAGVSKKDVDIFLYPHSNTLKGRKSKKTIIKLLESIGYKIIRQLDFHEYDKKIVYLMEYDKKRVDIFFVK